MFKIEKFLLGHKFKKVREYESGVIVYSDIEEEYEYVTEASIYTKHEPPVYEIMIRNPFAMIVASNHDYDKKFWKDQIKTHKFFAEECVKFTENIYNWLKEEVKDPWEIVE